MDSPILILILAFVILIASFAGGYATGGVDKEMWFKEHGCEIDVTVKR
jgi:hypothetical protein